MFTELNTTPENLKLRRIITDYIVWDLPADVSKFLWKEDIISTKTNTLDNIYRIMRRCFAQFQLSGEYKATLKIEENVEGVAQSQHLNLLEILGFFTVEEKNYKAVIRPKHVFINLCKNYTPDNVMRMKARTTYLWDEYLRGKSNKHLVRLV